MVAAAGPLINVRSHKTLRIKHDERMRTPYISSTSNPRHQHKLFMMLLGVIPAEFVERLKFLYKRVHPC